MADTIQNEIIETIDLMSQKYLETVSFDKTEVGEVVSKNEKNGSYWIQNGSLKYEAYPAEDNKSFATGRQVYVLVPQGDYNQKKVIIGYYDATSEQKEEAGETIEFLPSDEAGAITFKKESPEKEIGIGKPYDRPAYEYCLVEYSFDVATTQGEYTATITFTGGEDEVLAKKFSNQDILGNPYNLTKAFSFKKLYPLSFPVSKIKIKFETDIDNVECNVSYTFGYNKENIQLGAVLYLEKKQSLDFSKENVSRTIYLDYITDSLIKQGVPDGYKCSVAYYEDGKEFFTNYATGLTFETGQEIKLHDNLRTDQWKVKVYDKGGTFEQYSNTLVFVNQDLIDIPEIKQNADELLNFTIDKNGVFNLYGLDGRMVELNKEYNISFDFADGLAGRPEFIKKTTWVIPSENTMIESIGSGTTDEGICSNTFRIKTLYLPGAMNNTITCSVLLTTGETRIGKAYLQFGELTSNGTEYGLNIDFAGGVNHLDVDGEERSAKVVLSLVKRDGTKIDTSNLTVKWDILNNSQEYTTITEEDKTGATVKYSPDTKEISGSYCAILKATIEDFYWYGSSEEDASAQKTNLEAYLPLPVAKSGYSYISGPTRVVYSFDNTSYSKSSESYALFNTSGTDVEASFSVATGSGFLVDNKAQLQVPDYFINEVPPAVNVVAKDSDGNVCWVQPILVISNSWEHGLVNEWDGTVKVDGDNQCIASPFFIAGKKNNKNQLTGLVIDKNGIVGSQNGSARFKLNTNGTFSFQNDDGCVKLDDNGNFVVKTKKFEFNASTYEEEDGKTIKTPFYISSSGIDKYWINFNNKFTVDTSGNATIGGWQISDGSIWNTAKVDKVNYEFRLWNPGTAGGTIISCENKTTKKYPFYVNRDGGLFATTGSIANWNFSSNSFYKEVTNEDGDTYKISLYAYDNYYHNDGQDKTRAADVFVLAHTPNGGNTTWPFVLRKDGSFFATRATITGNITADSGIIGGCKIEGGKLKIESANISSLSADRITNGTNTNDGITFQGSFTATNATITGNITATSGKIAGWTISSNALTSIVNFNTTKMKYTGVLASGTTGSATGWAGFVLTSSIVNAVTTGCAFYRVYTTKNSYNNYVNFRTLTSVTTASI